MNKLSTKKSSKKKIKTEKNILMNIDVITVDTDKLRKNFGYPIKSFFIGDGQWKLRCYDNLKLKSKKPFMCCSDLQIDINKNKKIIEELLNISKWENVYYCNFGKNYFSDWIIVCKHKNGNYIYFRASCDYTGFISNGHGEIYYTTKCNLFWNFCLDNETRFLIMLRNGYKFNIKM